MITREDVLRDAGEPMLARLSDVEITGDDAYIDGPRGGYLLTLDIPESWREQSKERTESAIRAYAKMARVEIDEDEIQAQLDASEAQMPDEMHVGFPLILCWN